MNERISLVNKREGIGFRGLNFFLNKLRGGSFTYLVGRGRRFFARS